MTETDKAIIDSGMIEEHLEKYEEKLMDMDDEELLGEECLGVMRMEEIDRRLEVTEEELGELDNDDLLGQEFMDNFRQETICKMVEAERERLETEMTK